MADEEEREITSEDTNHIIIEEDELELCLGLRPIQSSSKNLLERSGMSNLNGQILSKCDAQALRRKEAKKRRDLKRKSHNLVILPNDVVINEAEEDFSERRRKIPNLVAPPWRGGIGGGFKPYQGQNGKFVVKDGESKPSISGGSSSGISDNYQTTSGPGGSTSDAGSHSSRPQSQSPTPNLTTQPCSSQVETQPTNLSQPQFQLCSYSSNPIEPATSSRQALESSPEGAMSSNTQPREIGKPPKPTIGQQKLVDSQMPCVSTTGNGPNGKTVTGILYRYTKAEVTIVCVCHGASFSPAGFVEHAGGVDIEHPLRHITVAPLAFGHQVS